MAIVSSEPGTTRDAVEATLVLGGRVAVVADTAGARAARRGVEAEGVRRARVRAADADVVVLVLDARVLRGRARAPRAGRRARGRAGAQQGGPRRGRRRAAARAFVRLLSDATPRAAAASDVGNARDVRRRRRRDARAGRRAARDPRRRACRARRDARARSRKCSARRVEARAGEVAGDGAGGRTIEPATARGCASACTTSARSPRTHVGDGEARGRGGGARLAARALGRVTGAVDVEELLDVIFSDFCIGK